MNKPISGMISCDQLDEHRDFELDTPHFPAVSRSDANI